MLIGGGGDDFLDGRSANDLLSGGDGDDTVIGGMGSDIVTGGAGADQLSGGLGQDTLNGDGGDDQLSGGEGGDTFVFGLAFGTDVISDFTVTGPEADRIRFDLSLFSDFASMMSAAVQDGADVVFSAAGNALRLENVDKSTLTAANFEFPYEGSGGGETLNGGSGNDMLSGLGGNDTLNGNGGDDTLIGGLDDDSLHGGAGSDVYRYASGDGNDVIDESGAGTDTDKLILTGLNASDVTFVRRSPASQHLLITVTATGEVITVDSHFYGPDYGIEQIEFADGTIWDRNQILAASPFEGTASAETINGDNSNETFAGLGGDDTINGNGGNDTLIGGAGNDTLRGGSGSDDYRYASGDGNDVIDESGAGTDTDKLILTDLNASDVSFVRRSPTSQHLLITVTATGEVITVDSHFWAPDYGIEQIEFADGTIWDRNQILAAASYEGTASGETIDGDNSNDTIFGLAGNDTVNAGGGNDTLIGGAGHDTLRGGSGGDVYRYASGDGNDVIDESGAGADTDKLVLTDLNASDVTFVRRSPTTQHLLITVTATGEVITVDSHFWGPDYGIEQIEFADGTIWDRNQMLAAAAFEGTASGETIDGDNGNDTIAGLGGNDTINGSGGNDTLIGGAGHDTLRGGSGSDVYRYASGDGNDVIAEGGSAADTDRLVLTNLNAADVTFVRRSPETQDLLITVTTTGEVITVDSHFWDPYYGIEQIEFADGTIWDRNQMLAAAAFEGTASGETINGESVDDTIAGLAGNDTLNGNGGNDALAGGLDNDTIRGQDGNDTISGDGGNDYVRGDGGSDVYIYRSGDGNDNIDDESGSTIDVDVLKLTDLNATDLTVSRSGDHAILAVNGTGETITLSYQFYSTSANWGVEQIQFANGATWDLTQIRENAWIRGTAAGETVTGFSGNDTLIGEGGDDTLNGNGGNDVFVFKPGFGSDIIVDFAAGSGAGDVIEFKTDLFADFSAVLANAAQVGSDTVITFDANTKLTLQNVALANLAADDFRHV